MSGRRSAPPSLRLPLSIFKCPRHRSTLPKLAQTRTLGRRSSKSRRRFIVAPCAPQVSASFNVAEHAWHHRAALDIVLRRSSLNGHNGSEMASSGFDPNYGASVGSLCVAAGHLPGIGDARHLPPARGRSPPLIKLSTGPQRSDSFTDYEHILATLNIAQSPTLPNLV